MKRNLDNKHSNSHIQLGDIGTNGFILINTSQSFDYITPSAVAAKLKSSLDARPNMYFLSGFSITTDTLKISPKAIQRVQILIADNYSDGQLTIVLF